MKLKIIIPLAGLAVAATTVAQAHTVAQGSVSLFDTESPSFSGGSDITNASNFTINDYQSNNEGLGVFAGLPAQDFGSLSFSTNNGASLTFGNAVFGTFTSSQIVQTSVAVGAVSYNVIGVYSSGTFDADAIVDQGASLGISFTETPAFNGSVSDSATFSTPAIPEPSVAALSAVSGLAGLLLLRRRK